MLIVCKCGNSRVAHTRTNRTAQTIFGHCQKPDHEERMLAKQQTLRVRVRRVLLIEEYDLSTEM
jgi:hypothetical protein